MRLFSILFLSMVTCVFAQTRPGDPYYDDAPPSPCGPIDADRPCYVYPVADYNCTGIGGCYKCLRNPFTLNDYACRFVEDSDGVCKCWAEGYGQCGSEGTCTYLRGGDPNP